jgi:hypothetical protein
MNGTDFTFAKLGKVADEIYTLYSFGAGSVNDGEFLSFVRDDVTRYAVHIHFYKRDLETEEDKVKIACHAIWAKSKVGWWRQQLTLEATRNGDRWTATLKKGDTLFIEGEEKPSKWDPPVNEALKQRLYEEVVDQLTDILEYTLNEGA